MDRGLWWSEFPVREDPDLGAVRDLPSYEEFAAESLRRADEFVRTHPPAQPLVMAPDGAPRALLVALHGGGSAEKKRGGRIDARVARS